MVTEALNRKLALINIDLVSSLHFFQSPYNFTGYTPMDRGNQSSFLCIFWEERSLHLVFLIEELSGKCALLLQNIRCLQKKSEGCRKFRGEIGQKSLSRSFKHIKKVSSSKNFFQLYSSLPPLLELREFTERSSSFVPDVVTVMGKEEWIYSL